MPRADCCPSVFCRSFFNEKSDLPLPGFRLGHEPPDGFEQGADVGIVTRDFSFQLGQLGRHLFVRGDHLAQSHEGPHHEDAHLNRPRTVEDIGRHDRPVLGEGKGRETGVAVPLGTGRNLRPVLRTIGIRNPANQPLPFRLGQTEYEIRRKSIRVALTCSFSRLVVTP